MMRLHLWNLKDQLCFQIMDFKVNYESMKKIVNQKQKIKN